MSRSLPATPTIEALKKQAKQLLKAHKDRNVSGCATLKLLHRFKDKPEAEILNSALRLADAQFALAMDYGFKNWAELKGFLDTSVKVKKGVTLDWKDIVGDEPNCRIENGDLVVENTKGEGAGLHAEFGGMSWDNYRLGVDLCIEKNSSQNAEFAANVQLCPRGTTVYCQVFGVGRSWGNTINLWHWDIYGKKDIHIAHVPRSIALNTWYSLDIVVQSPSVSIFFDREKVVDNKLEVQTDGQPGLIVNFASDGRVRLRNLRIRFLMPTRLQVEEYGQDAATNWTNYKRREIEAGRRKSMDDDSL